MLPIMETERLLLRSIELRDALDMFEYAKTPYVGPSAGWIPHHSLEQTETIIQMFKDQAKKTGLGVFAIVLKETGKMIGTIELYNHIYQFKAELGYALNHHYWGNGYTAEAAKAVLRWGFRELQLKRIEVGLFISNHQSERVCEKLGMTFECIKKKGYRRYDGVVMDEKIYRMTDDEFAQLYQEDN